MLIFSFYVIPRLFIISFLDLHRKLNSNRLEEELSILREQDNKGGAFARPETGLSYPVGLTVLDSIGLINSGTIHAHLKVQVWPRAIAIVATGSDHLAFLNHIPDFNTKRVAVAVNGFHFAAAMINADRVQAHRPNRQTPPFRYQRP